MREPGDDAKHNHQRSFTTMIIKGGYYYQYFVIEDDEENGDEIEIWERIPKEIHRLNSRKEIWKYKAGHI